jgi:hypothetical protein
VRLVGAKEAEYVLADSERQTIAVWEVGGFTRQAYVRAVEGEP